MAYCSAVCRPLCVSFASVFRRFLCFGVICNPPEQSLLYFCSFRVSFASVFRLLLCFVCFCVLFVSFISAFRLFLRFVCFCVLFVSAFRRFLCFGVICNPPNYTIMICNLLKPPRLAVSKQGAVNRIANPYNKNRRIANHAGTKFAVFL